MADTGPSPEDVDNWFTYHPPSPLQSGDYEALRSEARDLAEEIVMRCPPSRERSTALTKVREAVMWANAAIACNPEETPR